MEPVIADVQNSEIPSEDRFKWISDIIHTNVVAKLRGRSFTNVLDINTKSGGLLIRLKTIFENSRYFAYCYKSTKQEEYTDPDIRVLKTEEELHKYHYDLVASVFDIHPLNLIQVNDFLKVIHTTAGPDSTIVVSDIAANTFMASMMLKVASLFNPRLKSVLSINQITEMLENKGFQIVDKDVYKINEVWSAWIITCKKLVVA